MLSDDYQRAIAAGAVLEAELQDIRTRVRGGELVETAKVDRIVITLALQFRDHILASPYRQAARIAAAERLDAAALAAELIFQVRKALAELAGTGEAEAATEREPGGGSA